MSEKSEEPNELTLEHRILIQVRQVLASVVRDVAPLPGMRNPLSESTIEDIRGCFALIAARERELNEALGRRGRPVYVDEAKKSQVVEFSADQSGSEDKNRD